MANLNYIAQPSWQCAMMLMNVYFCNALWDHIIHMCTSSIVNMVKFHTVTQFIQSYFCIFLWNALNQSQTTIEINICWTNLWHNYTELPLNKNDRFCTLWKKIDLCPQWPIPYSENSIWPGIHSCYIYIYNQTMIFHSSNNPMLFTSQSSHW